MIKSMTGFGSAKGNSGKLEITVEVKSVNNRHLDCSIKIPRVFASIEETLKAIVSAGISRGKVDISVFIDSSNADDIDIKVNHSLAKAYIKALREVAWNNELSDEISVTDLTRYPDILQASRREVDTDLLCKDISGILKTALTNFDEMRTLEGERLGADISARLTEIEKLTSMAEQVLPETVALYRSKLEGKIKDILGTSGIDEARILTEAAIFADKISTEEETVRLRSHIAQLRDLLEQKEPVGRKIDFLVQEFNREANTIGSKGNNSQMSRIIVDLKAEIEKIREQAQNIE
ncbi:MAG: YicC family protein [Oscillospiraceae bacterium]|nr:YicC family protein [Oscillospiraceae bacterium]